MLAKAQDQPHKSQPDSLIKTIPIEGRSSREAGDPYYVYTIGGKLATPEDVKMRLLRYAPSAYEYHAARTNFAWAYVSLGGFALSGFAATLEYVHNNKHAGETVAIVNGQTAFVYQHHSLAGAYIFTGIATGFLTSYIMNVVNGARHGRKAIRLYNQQYE